MSTVNIYKIVTIFSQLLSVLIEKINSRSDTALQRSLH